MIDKFSDFESKFLTRTIHKKVLVLSVTALILFALPPSLDAHQSGHNHKSSGISGSPPMGGGGKWMNLEKPAGKKAGSTKKGAANSSCGSAAMEDGWLGLEFSGSAGADGGMVIKSVLPGGEAEKAGLQPGDILTGVKGNKISNLGEVENIVASLTVGSRVKIQYTRKGTEAEAEVTVTKRQMFMQGPGMMMMGGVGGGMGGMRPMFNGQPLRPGMFRKDMMKQSPMMTMSSAGGGHSMPPVMVGGGGSRIQPPMIPLESGKLDDSYGLSRSIAQRRNEIGRILAAGNDLNLMGAQIKRLKMILRNLKKQNIKLEAEIKISEIELEELLGEPDVNLEAVEKKIREIERAKAQTAIAIVKAEKKAKEILTDQQKKKFSGS